MVFSGLSFFKLLLLLLLFGGAFFFFATKGIPAKSATLLSCQGGLTEPATPEPLFAHD